DQVYGAYVWIKNNANKSVTERAAIDKMLPILRQNPKFDYMGLLLQVQYIRPNPNLCFTQLPIWLLAAAEFILYPVGEIAIGYQKNTPGAPNRQPSDLTPETERLSPSYQPFMYQPMPKLVFPLLGETKAEILERLSPELRELCVYCGFPVKGEGGF